MGGNRTSDQCAQARDFGGLDGFVDLGFADQNRRHSHVGGNPERLVDAGPSQVGVDDEDPLATLRHRNGQTHRDRRLAILRARARHDQVSKRTLGAHEHDVGTDRPTTLGHRGLGLVVDDQIGPSRSWKVGGRASAFASIPPIARVRTRRLIDLRQNTENGDAKRLGVLCTPQCTVHARTNEGRE